MKTRFFIILIFYPFLTFGSDKFQLEDFSIQLEQITSDPSHIWVSSGYTTVNPKHHTIFGVNDFFSPPFAARRFNLKISMLADSNIISDDGSIGKGDVGLLYAGGTWFPYKIIRYGTYHHLKDGKLISLGITSELIPLFGHAGFIEKITVKNRASTPVDLKLLPELVPGNPGVEGLSQWGFGVPQPNVRQAISVDFDRWANKSVNVGLYRENETAMLVPGKSMTTTFTVMVCKKEETLPDRVNAAILENETVNAWQKRLDIYTKNIPPLASNIDGMDDYYRRSIISGLVCLYENPSFALNPFLTSCGMDGGGFCTYTWDVAYYPQIAALMLDNKMITMVKKMTGINLENHYAISLDGTGVGVKYSYDPWSFTSLISTIFKFIGPDRELFNFNKTLILNEEQRKSSNNLIDYGFQHNLLEMRGAGWEHYVVSPNAERNWCFQQLAEMGKLTGTNESEMSDWKRQAGEIIAAVRNEL